MTTPTRLGSVRRDPRRVAGLTAPPRFLDTVEAHPDLVLLRSMRGEAPDPGTRGPRRSTPTWCTGRRRAAGAGLRPGQRILLMMRNRPDFHWFDLAAQFLRATPVSIYNSSSPEEIQYLADHAEAEIAIVEDAGFLDRILEVRDELPRLKHIFVLDPPTDALPAGVQPAADLFEHGRPTCDELAADLARRPRHADLHLRHDRAAQGRDDQPVQRGLHRRAAAPLHRTRRLRVLGKRVVSYLPMAHIAERMTSHYQGIGPAIAVTCCPDPTLIATYAREVQPEIMFGVPRVWEKVYLGVNAALAADPEKQAAVRRGSWPWRSRSRPPSGPARHPGAARHVGVPRRRGLLPRSRAGRARRRRRRHLRRGADPPADPRVVQRDRRAA